MSLATAFEIKGWCPGALRPMESGDGLLVRVRPWCGRFTLDHAEGLARIAATLGNGHIDLTRRANLQIRGLRQESMPDLHDALDGLGLLDPDAETEAARNVMVAPLAVPEVRALANELTQTIVADRRVAALPAKFGWLVDGAGGLISIADERANISLYATPEGVALAVDGQWLGRVERNKAIAAALAVSRGERPALAKLDAVPTGSHRLLGALPDATGVAVPFGRIEADQLQALVTLARKAGASEIHLSPWRTLYIDAPLQDVEELGLIVDPADPLLRIDACPGAPACRSASVDTRATARRLAAMPFTGSIHVSGCAKGCARSAPAELVLVGDRGHYGVVHGGTTRDAIERTIDPTEVTADV